MVDRILTYEELEKKIVNLHAANTKLAERVSRQAARITELEALYAGTKRSKKAANIKAKYEALKAYCEARDVR
jgi:N-acetylmuramic acid 6-phosphate (MurNAc-6-P) etherase